MTIGFDGSRAFVAARTGTENYSFQLLKALAKIDKDNQYLVYLRSGIPSLTWRGWPGNFRFKEISWPRLWTQAGLAVQTFKDHLDVLFIPAHTIPVIRRPDLKTVITVHDLGSEYLPSMHQIRQRFYLGFMQKVQLKTATKIIAVSKATKEDLVKRVGLGPDKVSVIYEGYDREKFKVQNSKLKVNQIIKKYNLMYHNYFLFVGTVQPRKNLERLIKAFARYLKSARLSRKAPLARPITRYGFVSRQVISSDIKRSVRSTSSIALTDSDFAASLIIVGSKGWLADEIYELPIKLGIEDRVKFLGYVPEKDLPALYSGAVALTFPSLFEGFGLPILEAQACGVPVLTSNVSSMPEVAGQGAIYVNPYSVDDIVEGMERIKNQELRIKLVKAGFENVKRFSWEKCAVQTLEVLLSS